MRTAILCIETSTKVCSVALVESGKTIHESINKEGQNHAKLLGPFIERALNEAKHLDLTLCAIAVSAGPGSYTGLRIGVSVAKGLCYGLDLPLIAIPTLAIMTANAKAINGNQPGFYRPLMDARRMEVYTGLFTSPAEQIEPTRAEVITTESFADELAENKIYFFGNGAPKCQSTLTHPHAHWIKNSIPRASSMAELADRAFATQDFVDVAYFEPFYLKEFRATVGKNKVLSNLTSLKK